MKAYACFYQKVFIDILTISLALHMQSSNEKVNWCKFIKALKRKYSYHSVFILI